MKKTIGLNLNEFATTPPSLRADPAIDIPAKRMSVDPANLYHHYYKDKHGRLPPDPDPAHFEHLRYFQ
jgi:hypothetical protein